jgi:hypothetical protein
VISTSLPLSCCWQIVNQDRIIIKCRISGVPVSGYDPEFAT